MIITLVGADFSGEGKNIGTLTTWTIATILGEGATYNGAYIIDRGATLDTTVTLADGYEIGSDGVTVTMGGNVVEGAAVVNGSTIDIDIAAVTGRVIITVPTKNTATGEEDGGNEDGGNAEGGTANAIEFTFDSATENGVNLASAGTVSDGILTISTASPIDYTGITFANDSDWTFECIAFPSTATGLIPIGAGSTKGGFIQLPNPQGADTACIRFRDKDRTMSAEASWTTGYTTPAHFAVVYSATNKTLKMYMNYQELTVAYSTGSIDTFATFTSAKLFGGYTDTYNYVGALHYMRFSNSALSVSDFHRE